MLQLGSDVARRLLPDVDEHQRRLGVARDLAERLPKALIHHNVPGQPVHELLTALDDAWDRSAAYAAYGPRQRWTAACAALAWPQAGPVRSREGELTVPWASVAPR